MRSWRAKLVAAIGVCLAVAVPTGASLYLAHRQSLQYERANADAAAGEVLRRMDAMGDEALEAYQRLAASSSVPCSESQLSLMRAIDTSSEYLHATGYVEGGKLKCSSLGTHGNGIDLGPVTYTSLRGTRIRASVDLQLGGDRRFLVFEQGGYSTATMPEMLVDSRTPEQDMAVGAFGESSRVLLSKRGGFDPAWMTKNAGSAGETSFYDGRYLVVLRRSSKFDVTAYAAIPEQALRAHMLDSLLLLMPMGLVLGAVLAGMVLWAARYRASLPAVIQGALKRKEFTLHYQPIVDLRDRRVVGVEALLRWTRADGSYIRPDVFIPVAEDCGLIQRITAYVMDQLAIDAQKIVRARPDCYISFNLSSEDLHSRQLVDSIEKLLAKAGIEARNLVVEATEHSMIKQDMAQNINAEIRALGVRIAIDDFGTGYSGLAYLTRLQSDFLKIDRTFVESIGTDSATSDVAIHIIQIARSLNLKVIAEGVESEVQAEFLTKQGADCGQGWLFGRPMPLDRLLVEILGPACDESFVQ